MFQFVKCEAILKRKKKCQVHKKFRSGPSCHFFPLILFLLMSIKILICRKVLDIWELLRPCLVQVFHQLLDEVHTEAN